MDDRDRMLEILGHVIKRMDALEAEGRVSRRTEIPIANGIRYDWPTPTGTKIVVQCIGPITEKGAHVQVGTMSPCGETTWLPSPPIYDEGEEYNQERLYPAPRPKDNPDHVNGRILNLIAQIIDGLA
jgi:hypothetical protein